MMRRCGPRCAIAAALALVLGGGCAREPTTPPASWVVTEAGIGPLEAGMTIAAAAAAVPGSFTAPAAQDCTWAAWSDAPPGVAIMVERGSVSRIDVTGGAIATAAGARIGDTEERIRQLYAGRVEVMPHKYSDGHYLVVRPADAADRVRLIVFETDGTRVTRYRAGRRPAVQYVEGCG